MRGSPDQGGELKPHSGRADAPCPRALAHRHFASPLARGARHAAPDPPPDIEDRPITTDVKDTTARNTTPGNTTAGGRIARGFQGGLALLCVAACHGRLAAAASRPLAEPNRSAEAAYSRPPVLVGAHGEGNGRVGLDGWAQPGSRIRLASPRGDASLAEVDARGAWRLTVAAPGAPQLFGLSMIERGRTVQSEGYVLVTPEGSAAQLRAGAGAVVVAGRGGGAAILAVDFDSKGGAVVSGRATPRSALEVWVDGARLARAAATPAGRFSAPLDQPLTFSDHRVDIRDGAGRADAVIRLAPPAPLLRGPYRASAAPGGWRIDWMTPGGGLQTTLLLAPDRSPDPAPIPGPSPNRGAP